MPVNDISQRIMRDDWARYFRARAVTSLANAEANRREGRKQAADGWMAVMAGEEACAMMIGGEKTIEECLAALKESHPLPQIITDQMVTRFLTWPLPSTVCPDPCVMNREYPNRVGTNLLTAIEAKQMLEHVLGIK